MLKRVFPVFLMVVLVVAALPVHVTAQDEGTTYWPTEGWRTSTPEEQGMDSEMLAAMLNLIQEKDYPVDNLLIIRNGYVVLDAAVYPSRHNERHILYSVTKSVTSTLVGIAMDEGYIDSVDQPVLEFFQGRTIANVDERKQAMTLEHLLTMTSGFSDLTSLMERSEDWVQFALDQPVTSAPGALGSYISMCSHLLIAIVSETTGMSPLDYAQEKLFDPLGISDVVWPTDPQGIPIGYSELRMTPSDLAKIGYLYLHDGQWDGRQVVPADWVAASTTPHSQLYGVGYGYQWWVVENSGFYAAMGILGQWLMVVPDKDLVVVFTSRFDSASGQNLPPAWLTDFIVPSAQSDAPLPENADGAVHLASSIEALAHPEPESVPPLPEMAQDVTGMTYTLEPNDLAWTSISLAFDNDEALFAIVYGDRSLELPVGLDDVFRVTTAEDHQLLAADFPGVLQSRDGPLALKGYWKDDKTFIIRMRVLGFVEDFSLELTFEGDSVEVQAKELAAYAFGAVGKSSTRFQGVVQ